MPVSLPPTFPNESRPVSALLLTGGGARAAYQVGVLRGLARTLPQLAFPILTGVSAGAINAALLGNIDAEFPAAIDRLAGHWQGLTLDQVFHPRFFALGTSLWRRCWGAITGRRVSPLRGWVETEPLRRFLHQVLETRDGRLHGVAANLERRRFSAVGIMTTSYPQGESVAWVQGNKIAEWKEPGRRGVRCALTVEHVMASSALPLLFPAAHVGEAWHGDGGVKLTSPFAPALKLGADRILTISTLPAPEPTSPSPRYPRPGQVMGVLLNSIFLDVLEEEALALRRVAELKAGHPRRDELGLKPVDVLVMRPSCDLGRLADEYESELPARYRRWIRRLGPGFLATLLFQPGYLNRLLEVGEKDGIARSREIAAFLGLTAGPAHVPQRAAEVPVAKSTRPASAAAWSRRPGASAGVKIRVAPVSDRRRPERTP